MRAALRHALALVALVVLPATAMAQDESRFMSDLRREGEHLAENCSSFSRLLSCAMTVATDYPFHLAMGSLAPGNGFSLGLAFVERYTPSESWRLKWNADAVRSFGGSWRAGAYMKLIHTPVRAIGVVQPGSGGGPAGPSSPPPIREYPVFDIYLQAISLNEALFFGIGPDSLEEGRSLFAERQTIAGAGAIYPIGGPAWVRALRPSLVGAVHTRSVRLRGNDVDGSIPIDQLYDELSAPGLNDTMRYWQFEEGVRLKPSLPNGRLRFNYLVDFEQFNGPDQDASSFHRWTADLNHEIPLYRTGGSPSLLASAGADTNGPNECFISVSSDECPAVSYSRNRTGAVSLRLLVSSSSGFGESRVPFYFQRTLGGSDINGHRTLAGFEDSRFRGPHLIALQQGVEHSLWGPIGVYALAEQGKVSDARRDLGLSDLQTSYAVGLTVRAGGLPMINVSFAWSAEGNHIIGTIDTSLLGGSSRPSLH